MRCFALNSPTELSSRPERTQISYLATLPTATYVAFLQRKPQEVDQRHQASLEIWGSEVEGPAVSFRFSYTLFSPCGRISLSVGLPAAFSSSICHDDVSFAAFNSREEGLKKAMPVFWKHGFANTSLRELE
jgi:hypothetical protein